MFYFITHLFLINYKFLLNQAKSGDVLLFLNDVLSAIPIERVSALGVSSISFSSKSGTPTNVKVKKYFQLNILTLFLNSPSVFSIELVSNDAKLPQIARQEAG